MRGKAQTVSRTVAPSQVLPHHSKYGRNDSLSISERPSHGYDADPHRQRAASCQLGAPGRGAFLIPGRYAAEDRLVEQQRVQSRHEQEQKLGAEERAFVAL